MVQNDRNVENKKEDCYGNKSIGFSRLTMLNEIESFSKYA